VRALRYLGVVLMAIPNTVMAALFLATWIDPRVLGKDSVQFMLTVIVLEAITVHASGFLLALGASKLQAKRKVTGLIGLGLLYSIFAGAICSVFSTWWPFFALWGLIVNKILGVLVSPDTDLDSAAMDRVMFPWIGSVSLFFVLMFAVSLVPLPTLGTFPIGIRTAHDYMRINNPHQGLALGFFYFSGLVFFGVWRALWNLRRYRAGVGRTVLPGPTAPANRTPGRSPARAEST